MLFIIGTGLNDYRDISLRSLEILRYCEVVYQENYTCIQAVDFGAIEDIIQKKIILADRKLVEETYEILMEAKTKNIAFLVAGTPMFATTHNDLLLRAKEEDVRVKVVHNTSIASVKGCFGLYSYNFGCTISIPYFTETWKPTSFLDRIYSNYRSNMHTLCLLDIKVDEKRFMTVNEAVEQLLESSEIMATNKMDKESIGNSMCNGSDQICNGVDSFFNRSTKLFAICRFATDDELVVYDSAENLLGMDFGPPLHSLIIPAPLSVIEREFIEAMYMNK